MPVRLKRFLSAALFALISTTVGHAQAPTAKDDCSPPTSVPYNTPVTIDVLANDLNPGGLPLTITKITQPVHGSAQITTDKTKVTYTPNPGFVGNDQFQYTISNGQPCPPEPCPGPPTILTEDLGDRIAVTFIQSRNVNDNTYGANTSPGWGGPDKHKFGDLVGSDKAEFVFTNAAGQKVLDFYVDYISASATAPCGYASLGVSGGEGKMITGSAAYVLEATSSLSQNLQNPKFCGYTVDSPAPESAFPDWEYRDIYYVEVSKAAFGASGFGTVSVPFVHNSPQMPCPSGTSTCDKSPQLITQTLPNGDVQVTYIQSRNVNDNTYGTGSSPGWGTTGHKFNDLVGSDKAEFVFTNAAGMKVLDFTVDYISASASAPCGYASLGVSGGEGKMITGSAAYVKQATTSLSQNLQNPKFCSYLVNSPTPESAFPDWEYRDIYYVTIAKEAFGASGFGSVSVPLVHNSPAMSICWYSEPCESTATVCVVVQPALTSICGQAVCEDALGTTPLSGVTVTLSSPNYGTAMATTDIQGRYCFDNLPPDTYTVTAPSTVKGLKLTSNSSVNVTVVAGQTPPEVPFTYTGGLISGYALTGATDCGVNTSQRVPGITVTLTRLSDGHTFTTTTDVNGFYRFQGCDITQGAYRINAQNTVNTITLNAIPLTVNLDFGQSSENNIFCYGTVCGKAVCHDTSGDHLLSGVEVVLKDAAGHELGRVVTDQNGNYCFTALLPVGTGYTVTAPTTSQGLALTTTSVNPVTITNGAVTTVPTHVYAGGEISGRATECIDNQTGQPVVNALITLTNSSGQVVGSVRTDLNGFFRFAGCAIREGSYTLTAEHQVGELTVRSPGNITVSLTPGQVSPNNDFCYERPGRICGQVFCHDPTGILSPLMGVPVMLTDLNGNPVRDIYGNLVLAMATNQYGRYCFENLPPGTYKVDVPDTALGLRGTGAAIGGATVTVLPGLTATQDFTYEGSRISGRVVTVNCLYTTGVAVPGITVRVTRLSDNHVFNLTTDINGNFKIEGCEITEGPYSLSTLNYVNNVPLYGEPIQVNVTAGSPSDFNVLCFGKVCGRVLCHDTSGDTPMAGVLVTLKTQTGSILETATTDQNGRYCFNALLPLNGTFIVEAPTTQDGREIVGPATQSVKITTSNTNNAPDFVYQGAAISGYVYVCADGIQNGPISGVTVTLKRPDGSVVATTTTNAQGYYSFAGCYLKAGTYTVSVPQTVNQFTVSGSGSLNVIVAPGQSYTDNNFCYNRPGGLCGRVVCTDAMGTYPLQGVQVTLKNLAGQVLATRTTDSDGRYCFENLQPGTYTVEAPDVAVSRQRVSAGSYQVTIVANQPVSAPDFVYRGGVISGYAYRDTSRDCHLDPGETGLANVPITLTKKSTGEIFHTVTDQNGYYEFRGCAITAGEYTIQAPGTFQTLILGMSDTLSITLQPGESRPNNNFCYQEEKPCEGLLLIGPEIVYPIYNWLVNDPNGPRLPASEVDLVITPSVYDPTHPNPISDAMDAKLARDGVGYCAILIDTEIVGPQGHWSTLSPTDQLRLQQALLSGVGLVYAEPVSINGTRPNPLANAPLGQLPNVVPVQTNFVCDPTQQYRIIDTTSPLAVGMPLLFNAATSCQDNTIALMPLAGVNFVNVKMVGTSVSQSAPEFPGTGGPVIITFNYGETGGRVAVIGTDPYPQDGPLPGFETDMAAITRLYGNALVYAGHLQDAFGTMSGLRVRAQDVLDVNGGIRAALPADVPAMDKTLSGSGINISDAVTTMREATGK